MSFAKEMLEAQKTLQGMGHTAEVPCDTDMHIEKPEFIDNIDGNYVHCLEKDIVWKCFDLVAKADAILLLNYPKNNIGGYVGTSSLMELGLAYYLKKKLYLLYPFPDPNKIRWAHEVSIMLPVILNGDLKNLKLKSF